MCVRVKGGGGGGGAREAGGMCACVCWVEECVWAGGWGVGEGGCCPLRTSHNLISISF